MTLPAYAMNRASFPEAYERWLVGPLFRPWAELLVARLELAPGDSVLDVACGTGIVARVAKERLGEHARVVGVDLSPPMLAVARAVAPGIDWREGNAAALPVLDPERFDVVVCHQGLQFFPDKPVAAREMRRVLVPGGRLAVATWRPLEGMPLLRDLHRVAERHVGTIVDQRHSYGDPAVLGALLVDAGFRDVRVEAISQGIRFSDGSTFVRLNTMALVGMSAASKELGDEERGHIAAIIESDSAAVLSPYTDREGLLFELSANVASARA
jgi:ubiquinone/menaquinone biosynthesis C-methylase UbiE